MAHGLPVDVLELLFDEFQAGGGSDDDAVGQCGLVCRAWLPTSRSRLFTTVILREDNAHAFLDILQTSSFPVKSIIHTLRLIVHKKDTFLQEDSKAIQELGPFPEATTLSVETDLTTWIPRLAATLFPNNFPRLSNLNLSASAITIHDILVAVTPFQTLESLKLNGDRFDPFDASVPEVYQLPPRLHILHFEMDMSANFLEILFELSEEDAIDMPIFSTLSMEDGWPQGRSFVGRYIYSYGRKLQHLRFDCSSDNSEQIFPRHIRITLRINQSLVFHPPEALHYCTALRRLDLRFGTSKVPSTLLSVANQLNSPDLAAINVLDPDHFTFRSLSRHADKWEKLDQTLSEERFGGLRSLRFTDSRGLAEKLRQSMPLCAARGILRVTDA